MKIEGRKRNFRVVVTPRGLGDFGSIRVSESMFYGNTPDERRRREDDYLDRCSEMVSDIKRHVDNVGTAEVEFDQESVCSHCGHLWTEESSTYNGGCCDEDEANNPTSEKPE